MNPVSQKELDSVYLLLNRKASNIKVLVRVAQIDPRLQIQMMIQKKLYSTGIKFCDFLLENNFEGLVKENYERLQLEKGFYNKYFRQKQKS